MNASTIISDDMTLEEKLAAIDQAMVNVQKQANKVAVAKGKSVTPINSVDLTICEGCQ